MWKLYFKPKQMKLKPIYKLLWYFIKRTIWNRTKFSYSSQNKSKIKSNKEFDILTCNMNYKDIDEVNSMLTSFVWKGRGKDSFIEDNKELILELKEKYEELFSIENEEYNIEEINILDDIYTIYAWKHILENSDMEDHVWVNNLSKISKAIVNIGKEKEELEFMGPMSIWENESFLERDFMDMEEEVEENRIKENKENRFTRKKIISPWSIAAWYPASSIPKLSAKKSQAKEESNYNTAAETQVKQSTFLWDSIHIVAWVFFSFTALATVFYWIVSMNSESDDLSLREKINQSETVEMLQGLKEEVKEEIKDMELIQAVITDIDAKIELIQNKEIRKSKFLLQCETQKWIILNELCITLDSDESTLWIYKHEWLLNTFSVLNKFSIWTGMQSYHMMTGDNTMYFDGNSLYYILEDENSNYIYKDKKQVGYIEDMNVWNSELIYSNQNIKNRVDQKINDKNLIEGCENLSWYIYETKCISFQNEELTIWIYSINKSISELEEEKLYKIVNIHELLVENKEHLKFYINSDYISYNWSDIYYSLEFNNKHFLFQNGDNIINYEKIANLEKDIKKKKNIENLIVNHGYTFDLLMSNFMYKILGDVNGGDYKDRLFFVDESVWWLVWYIILSLMVVFIGLMLKNTIINISQSIYKNIRWFLEYIYYEIYVWSPLTKGLLLLTMNLILILSYKFSVYLTMVLFLGFIIILIYYYIIMYESFLKVIYSYFNFYYLNIVIVEEYQKKLEEINKMEKKDIDKVIETLKPAPKS